VKSTNIYLPTNVPRTGFFDNLFNFSAITSKARLLLFLRWPVLSLTCKKALLFTG
jgi:hypothetical protein